MIPLPRRKPLVGQRRRAIGGESRMTRTGLMPLVGLVLLLRATAAMSAPGPQGVWLTEDGDGAVEIFDCGELLCGQIAWQRSPLRPDGSPDIDDRNPDPALRGRPICGLQIIGDLRQSDPASWTDGWVYDPDSGKTYHANLTMESADTLRLRGYIGIPLLGENQLWHRALADLPLCATRRRPERKTGSMASPTELSPRPTPRRVPPRPPSRCARRSI
jgi:uncharacterized protein (DUF2147 family)